MGSSHNSATSDWRSDAIVPQAATPARRYQLLLETVDVSAKDAWSYMSQVVLGWRPWLRNTMGARMISANTQLTGRPGKLVHLWWVPWNFSLAEMHSRLYDEVSGPNGKWIRDLQSYMSHVSYELLMPTLIDPPRDLRRRNAAPAGGPTLPRLIDTITARPGHLDALVKIKQDSFIPAARAHKIELLASGTLITGSTRRLVNMWTLGADDALAKAMRAFSEQSWYQKMHRETIESEHQNILLPMSWYDPNFGRAPDSQSPSKR